MTGYFLTILFLSIVVIVGQWKDSHGIINLLI